jgi:2-oxoglutarate ferredoxin oxidoreductase subunit beta
MTAGWGSCPGCGNPLGAKAIVEAIEELGIAGRTIYVCGIGCSGGVLGVAKLDGCLAAHGAAPAVATGIKSALNGDAIVVTTQGDGDCAAIGAGYLVNAAARAERITIFMFDNTNYGTTGGQLAPTTLTGQVTSTTPTGRDAKGFGYPLHVPEMLTTFKGVAYAARTAVDSPANYQRTKRYAKTALKKQMDDVGLSFVEILCGCPVNWHMEPVASMKRIEREMMAEFPLGEFKNVDSLD